MAKRSPEDNDDVIITSENRENGSYDPDEDMAPSDNDNNNDEDDMNQHDDKKKKKKKKKKKRVRVMAGQTDNDRRVLRRRQRELHNDITMDVPAAEIGGARGGNNDDDDSSDDEQQQQSNNKKSSSGGGGVLSWREKNNALWDDVRYTREAVLDSENLDIITSKAAREVEKIVQVSTLYISNGT
jgi:adenine-specific DNA glycosylase